jgi:sec-independent protein translocase protein TatA
MNFGTTEILLVMAVIFLLFGASRLPQLAKSLGQTRKAFKEGMREAEEEERLEQEQKQINPTRIAPPQISNMSDEELMAEMRRRAQIKQP